MAVMEGFVGVRPTMNPRQPSVSAGDVLQGYKNASTLFGAGTLGFAKDLADKREQMREQNVASALAKLNLGGSKPRVGAGEALRPDLLPQSEPINESVSGFQTRALNTLIGAGARPDEALQLSTQLAKKYREDTGESFTRDKLNIERLGLGTKTATQPKTGQVMSFNTQTGKYDVEVMPGLSKDQLGSESLGKNIVIKEVEYKDANGNKIKRTVPVNKLTGNEIIRDENGNYVDSGRKAVSVERPTMSQADRDAALASKNALMDIKEIERLYSPDIVGPLDNAISWGLNAAGVNSERSAQNRKLLQVTNNLKANLTDALIKGVPSDRDLKMIEDMLPRPSDSEIVFKAKLKNIENILRKQNQNAIDIQEPRGGSETFKLQGENEAVSQSGRPIINIGGKWYYKD